MAGVIGTTRSSYYIWGVNHGRGQARFQDNGFGGILFERTVSLGNNGFGGVSGLGPLSTGVPICCDRIVVAGNTITAFVPRSGYLSSTGFSPLDYTWAVWTLDLAFRDFSSVADFAPDNANFPTSLVPEPSTVAMWFAGLSSIGIAVVRRRLTIARRRLPLLPFGR
ncbi:MAG TPA: PEP-CTERM sorting domain-containing protein [Rubrivivax sp.]|nr:PEP-CTERM sorting domain-containing protein [Rubrivivax sp.]